MHSIALATHRGLPQLSEDDQRLLPLLYQRGYFAEAACWDDPRTEWRKYDTVVIRSCWNYYRKPENFLKWLDCLESLGVRVFNPLKVIRWNFRKTYLRELAARGVATLPTIWVENLEQGLDQVRAQGWDGIVVKPVISADAFGMVRASVAEIDRHLNRLRRSLQRCPLMIQPYSQEVETKGEVSLIFFGGQFSHAVLKKPKPGDFRVQGNHGGSVEVFRASPEMIERASGILSLTPEPTLYGRVDLMPYQGGRVLGEFEVLEPSLYLSYDPRALDRFLTALGDFGKS